MDSAIAGWRALTTARYWTAVLVLTFAWSAGVGLALQAVLPARDAVRCARGPFHPPVASMVDLAWLPLHAFVASPYGLYESGLFFGIISAVIVFVPCAMLEQGVVRRVVGAGVVSGAAALVGLAGWSFELQHVTAAGVLPSLVCSN